MITDKMSKDKYVMIGKLVKNAQACNEHSTNELLGMFQPLLNKYSCVNGKVNEDLKSELILNFIKCIKNFKVDDKYFLKKLREHKSQYIRNI